MGKGWINVFVVFTLGFLSIQCKNSGDEQILAPVVSNGKPFITREDFHQAFSKFEPTTRDLPADSVRRLKKTLLDQMVEEKLILQKAGQLGIRVSDRELKGVIDKIKEDYPEKSFNDMIRSEALDLKAWRESLRKRIMINKTIKRVISDRITMNEGQLRVYYANHRELFYKREQVRARQIVVSTKEEAQEILKKLKKRKDFAKMAERYSISPDAKKGGDLGFFHPGQMPRKFDEVVFSLPVGTVSKVIQSPYGFHIFFVEEKKEAYRQPFSEVKTRIAYHLMKKLEEKAHKDWINTLRENAKLTFHFDQIDGRSTEASR